MGGLERHDLGGPTVAGGENKVGRWGTRTVVDLKDVETYSSYFQGQRLSGRHEGRRGHR